MNKLIRKIVLGIGVISMVFTLGFTSFAEESVPKGKVTVKNVEAGSTVTAYQIVKYDISGNYVPVVAGKPASLTNPSAADILWLASNTNQLTVSENLTYAKGNYEAELDAGMWLVLVSGSATEIYNPMIVSVNVSPDGAVAGSVDSHGNFVECDQVVYAKHSKPSIDKTVKEKDYELNDSLEFTVQTQIPAYQSNYKSVKFIVTDELSGGLVYDKQSIAVKIGGQSVSVTPAYTENDTKMTIDLSAIALANAGKTVEISYKAKLTDTAKANLKGSANESMNKAAIEYSNNPKNSSETIKMDDKTYHYTFGFSDEFQKIAAENNAPLANAEFELVKKVDGKYVSIPNIGSEKTDANGKLEFAGLDAGVTYYLHETKAPLGYTVRDEYIPVIIQANYDNAGKLTNYTVSIGNEQTCEEKPYTFKNTRLFELPSTGGRGIYVFIFAGACMMILSFALYVNSRRKAK